MTRIVTLFCYKLGLYGADREICKKYPDIYFAHATGCLSNGKNFTNYFGRIYQARYLSGIVAGLKTETNKIGYVSAMGSDNSECTGGVDAFAIGVESVNKKLRYMLQLPIHGIRLTMKRRHLMHL